MKKYTFILNLRGGTYISQVEEVDIKLAMFKWAKNIDTKSVQYLGQYTKNQIIELMEEEEPVLIEGMNNVWCICGRLKVGFFIANVVES